MVFLFFANFSLLFSFFMSNRVLSFLIILVMILGGTLWGYFYILKTKKIESTVARVVQTPEKKLSLTEQTKKKEETITTIKLKRDIQETLETNTGGVTLWYRSDRLFYALPSQNGWDIFMKKEWAEPESLFQIPEGRLTGESLDIYEGYIALKKWENFSFYALADATEHIFHFDKNILSVKDTLNDDTKIITSDTGVYMYNVSDKTSLENPLYDDIIQLPSGEIVVLVKKTSKKKQSLLSLYETDKDSVFLIGQDTRTRKILLTTPKNGKMLRSKNGEILFIDDEWWVFIVK